MADDAHSVSLPARRGSLGVFRAILNGVHERGEGGVLLVRGDQCAYCFPDDFDNDEFRFGLKKTLAMTAAQNFFFVVNQDAGAMHVLSYPRERVFREVRDAMVASSDAQDAVVEEGRVDVDQGGSDDVAPSSPLSGGDDEGSSCCGEAAARSAGPSV